MAYLVVPFDERFDDLDGVDVLDSMEKRWSALDGRARGSMIAWRGMVALFVCEVGGLLEFFRGLHW